MPGKRHLTVCLLLIILFFTGFAHAHTYRVPVLVDTDMALDDMRALTILLNSHMADIRLIVTSDGVVSPHKGARNLARLLNLMGRNEIPAAAGRELGKPAPPWRNLSENAIKPFKEEASLEKDLRDEAAREIVRILSGLEGRSVYLCLGPLTNLAGALNLAPGIANKISRLIYYGGHPDDPHPGWNTERDPDAARVVFQSGLTVNAMHMPHDKLLPFDAEMCRRISEMESEAAKAVTKIHSMPEVKNKMLKGHFQIWDEMAVIYLNRPSLFRFAPSATHRQVMVLESFDRKGVLEMYLSLLGHAMDFHLSPRQSVVLKKFPTDASLFRTDVKPHVKDIINRHGLEEWKACFLTNELHRHLGIYSLIGAKMGIRAREVLGAPFDELTVVSFAGKGPPMSCMNDGLQVSTGATLGRGTIKISDLKPRPAALFSHNSKRLTLTLKPASIGKIQRDISEALKQFGGLNQDYFSHIRGLSIGYWYEFDRKEIFEETME